MSMHSDATFQSIVDYTRSIYGPAFIPLHRPVFEGNEKQYLIDCIDSNFVSSVGAKVVEFEQQVAAFTGCQICSGDGQRHSRSACGTAIGWSAAG
jgi:perosamine synthetase